MLIRRLSPGTLIGIVAVLLASSGSAVAARAITGADIRNGSITSADIRDRSIRTIDLARSVQRNLATANRGPAGPAGPVGPTGPVGPRGSTGATSPTRFVESEPVYLAPGDVVGVRVACPDGFRVLGTGFDAGLGRVGFVENFGKFVGGGFINDRTTGYEVTVHATCGLKYVDAPGEPTSSERFRVKVDKLG